MGGKSEIADFYENKHIFITGATGFMGKVLIEKLLRSCPKLGAIYILVRPKKGKKANERIQDIINSPVFDRLRDHPSGSALLAKLRLVPGDVLRPFLDLSPAHLQTLRSQVGVVFHMAATVRFDQPLKTAALLNVGGTRNLLEVCCSFQDRPLFVHVSTSYCHCGEVKLEEKVYKAPHPPLKILDMVTWLDEPILEALTPKLTTQWPNTYAYTKCLTEQLVADHAHKLDIVIARPSIVTAAWREPLPGWVDNLNGPTGLLVGAGKGVIRSMHCDPALDADLVPVDCAINALIAIGWKEGRSRGAGPKVYHVTANSENTISWGTALELGRRHFYENPFSVCLWYPGGSIKASYWAHLVAVWFLHVLPAYLVDFLMVVTGNKPFLVRTQKRIQNGLEVLQYYTTRPWFFHNENLTRLWKEMSPTDQEIFFTDRLKINFDKYLLGYVLGARRYCVHEEPETLPYARKVLKRLYYLDLFKNIFLGVLLLWFFATYAAFFLDKIDPGVLFLSNGTRVV